MVRRKLEADAGTGQQDLKRRRLLRADANDNVGLEQLLPVQRRSDLWRWPLRFFHRMEFNSSRCNFLAIAVDRLTGDGLDMITEFSGLGAPEFAGDFIAAEIGKTYPSPVNLRFRRACDILPSAREVLAMHTPCLCAPGCIMGDHLERTPASVMEECRMFYDEAWAKARQRISAGESKQEVYRSEGKVVFDKAPNKSEQQRSTKRTRHNKRTVKKQHVFFVCQGSGCVFPDANDWRRGVTILL